MRAISLLGLVAACASPPRAAPPRAQAATPPAGPRGEVQAPAPPPSRDDGVHAPHAGAIIEVEVTAEGDAAISRDVHGGVRLWPALDGSREPVVVNIPRARTLGIAKRADGTFDVAAIDDAGGLAITRVAAGGQRLARAMLEVEPAVVAIATTDHGVLAQRADHTLELVGGDAKVSGSVAAEAGQRIVMVAAAGARAAALVELVQGDHRVQRARELVLAPQLAWGRWWSPAEEGDVDLAISPTGARLALLHRPAPAPAPRGRVPDPELVVVDTAAASVTARVAVANATSMRFLDDAHLAVASSAGLGWIATDEALPDHVPAHVSLSAPLAGGGPVVVSAFSGELVVAAPGSTEYLGYGLVSPTVASLAGDGKLAIGGDTRYTLVDRQWQEAGVPPFPADAKQNVRALQHLEGSDWVALDGHGVLQFTGTPHELRDTAGASQGRIVYEPSTHLLAVVRATSSALYRYDPAAHRLDPVAVPPAAEHALLVPVAPALANGAQLVHVTVADKLTLRWLPDANQLDHVSSSIEVTGTLDGVDAAGHVFVRDHGRPPAAARLGVYRDGAASSTLPDAGGGLVWPDPAGTRVVQIGVDNKASLYALDGTLRWARPVVRPAIAVWLDDGGLAIVGAAGAERVDPATGARVRARCGWQFGRAAQRHLRSQNAEPLCAEPVP